MNGIPSKIQTREDVLHLQSYLGTEFDTPEARADILAQLSAIRNTAQHYVFTRALADEIDRAGPEPEYRVMMGQGLDSAEIHEFHLVDDPGSRFAVCGNGHDPGRVDAVIALVTAS
jgi:hypothetical protein